MKVERERFLFLAAALTACGSGGNDAPPPQAATIPVQPSATAEPAATPPVATAPPPTPSSSQSTAAPDPSPVAHASSPNPYDGTPVTAQSCDFALNKVGKAPACKVNAPPGPTCESIADTKKECPQLNQLLKPRVAQAAVECMNRKSGSKDICEFNIAGICAYEALGSACLDPNAKTICAPIVQKCGPPSGHYNKMSEESCEAGVSGIAESKKKKFISCISEFCRFETCLYP